MALPVETRSHTFETDSNAVLEIGGTQDRHVPVAYCSLAWDACRRNAKKCVFGIVFVAVLGFVGWSVAMGCNPVGSGGRILRSGVFTANATCPEKVMHNKNPVKQDEFIAEIVIPLKIGFIAKIAEGVQQAVVIFTGFEKEMGGHSVFHGVKEKMGGFDKVVIEFLPEVIKLLRAKILGMDSLWRKVLDVCRDLRGGGEQKDMAEPRPVGFDDWFSSKEDGTEGRAKVFQTVDDFKRGLEEVIGEMAKNNKQSKRLFEPMAASTKERRLMDENVEDDNVVVRNVNGCREQLKSTVRLTAAFAAHALICSISGRRFATDIFQHEKDGNRDLAVIAGVQMATVILTATYLLGNVLVHQR